MLKRLLLIFISMFILSSCSYQNGERIDYSKVVNKDNLNGLELPISTKNPKISILTESTLSNQNDSLIIETLRKITGLNINIIPVKVANITQTLQTLIASKKLPDIFYCYLDDQTKQALAYNKTIVAIDKNINIMPNYKSLVFDNEENYKLLRNTALSDGHIYQIDTYGISRDINHCFMYRKDIFEKHNIKPWTNTEEFYQNLKAIKRLYPDSIPFTLKLKQNVLNYLKPQWGIQNNSFSFNESKNLWEYANTSDSMKDLMSFLIKLYNEGLLDKDFLTISETSWMTNITSEKSFVTFDWVDRLDMISNNMKDINHEFDLRIGYPIGTYGKYKNKTTFSNGGAYAVANNSNTEYSLKLMDFLISTEGAKLSTLGIEGITFNYSNNVNDLVTYIGFENNDNINIKDLEEKFGLFIPAIAIRFDQRSSYFNYTKRVKEAQEFVVSNNLLTEKIPYFDISTIDKVTYENTKYKLDLAFENYIVNFFANSHDFNNIWNEWLKEAQELNVSFVNKVLSESTVSYN